MYKCEMCGSLFSEPELVRYNKDEYNGVADLFGNWQYGHYEACPECGSEEFNSYCEEADDDRIAYYEKEGDEYVYYDSNECELYREPA